MEEGVKKGGRSYNWAGVQHFLNSIFRMGRSGQEYCRGNVSDAGDLLS